MTTTPSKIVQHRREGNLLIFEILVEELRDHEISNALQDRVLEVAASVQPWNIVFDIAAVKFIGSVGMLAFLGVRREYPDARIMIVNVSETNRKLLTVCRLVSTKDNDYTAFEIGDDVPSAIAMLN